MSNGGLIYSNIPKNNFFAFPQGAAFLLLGKYVGISRQATWEGILFRGVCTPLVEEAARTILLSPVTADATTLSMPLWPFPSVSWSHLVLPTYSACFSLSMQREATWGWRGPCTLATPFQSIPRRGDSQLILTFPLHASNNDWLGSVTSWVFSHNRYLLGNCKTQISLC